MTKKELVERVADEFGVSKAKGASILEAITIILADVLRKEGDTLVIDGIGRFKVKLRSAYRGRNPRTGEGIWIPAKLVTHFKPVKPKFKPKAVQP
jgi:nucleoid DNA-binding protein